MGCVAAREVTLGCLSLLLTVKSYNNDNESDSNYSCGYGGNWDGHRDPE